jgi:myosin-6
MECDKAMDQIGLTNEDKMNIYLTVAAVLHIGNIEFEDDPDSSKGGCRLSSKNGAKSLQICAKMLGLDPDELEKALISRVMQAHRGGKLGTVIMVPLKVSEAQNARDALAKVIYIKLFNHIVNAVNKAIPFGSSTSFIGLLDIAGFEYFPVNSFEQFCINYCNEKLQQFFNERILKEEQFIYEKEGLGLRKISYTDNQDCIDLIEAKNVGIFDLLDEESRLPTPSSTHFTMEVHNKYPKHFRLDVPRKSKLKNHREIRDDEGFLIRHFAGGVVYTTSQFIEKNNDALHTSLAFLIQECKNKFIHGLFASESESIKQNTGKLNFISVGGKFRTQLTGLLEKLRSTGTNFIRCVKPNLKMIPSHFEGAQILSQLQCSGMTSVLTLMQQGYPSRTSFADLYNMYKNYLPPQLARLDPRLFCKALFKALNLKDSDFKFGITKVFFKPGKFAEFDQIMRSDPENLAMLIARVKKWLITSRWKKAQWCALSVIKLKNKIIYRRECIITIQKNIRMWKCKKNFRPRIKGIHKIKTLQNQLESMNAILRELKSDKEQSSAQQSLQSLKQQMNSSIDKITNAQQITENEINKCYNDLFAACDRDLKKLKSLLEQQKNKEEQDRLRKIQEEMLRAQKQKEAEELQKRLEEEQRKQKLEIEARRKQEEEKHKLMEAEEVKNKALLESKQKAEQEERKRQEQIAEQEKRDHDLAMRLAPELTNGEVEPIKYKGGSSTSSLASLSSNGGAANRKHDLSKWKYAELRDAINTSCDLELLEACREEFHRRLKVYHAWKSKNKKQGNINGGTDSNSSNNLDMERAPQSIIAGLEDVHISTSRAGSTATPKKTNNGTLNEQRFFRIPFARPADQLREGADKKKGWWYSHFDGKWIARQMEIYDDKPAVLLLAGVDDMHMCELSLEETGLTMKQGAEILEKEFEDVWNKNGGMKYLSDHFGQISSKYVLQIMQRK